MFWMLLNKKPLNDFLIFFLFFGIPPYGESVLQVGSRRRYMGAFAVRGDEA